MVGLQTLDLAIGVRVPASQPNKSNSLLSPEARDLEWGDFSARFGFSVPRERTVLRQSRELLRTLCERGRPPFR